MILRSPAKINLFLRVLHKREDGYHELASLFQAISIFDILHISHSEVDSFTSSNPDLPMDDRNLVVKATHLFRRKTGETFPVSIHLEKHIPMQAGLGGGSSNAATTLWALNKMAGTRIDNAQLATWSSELGSDIPFFFSLGSAYCTGRGEIVKRVNIPISKVWIIKPPQGLSTPLVYKNIDLARLIKRDCEACLKDMIEGKAHHFNDLEDAAFQAMPELRIVKQQLQSLEFSSVLMSGSGTAFFCLPEAEKPASMASIPSNFFVKEAEYINASNEDWY